MFCCASCAERGKQCMPALVGGFGGIPAQSGNSGWHAMSPRSAAMAPQLLVECDTVVNALLSWLCDDQVSGRSSEGTGWHGKVTLEVELP